MKKIFFAFAILTFCVKVFSSAVEQFKNLRNPFQYHYQLDKHIKLARQNISALKFVAFMQINQQKYALLQVDSSQHSWVKQDDLLGLQKARVEMLNQQKIVLTILNKQKKQFFIIKRWVEKS